MAIADPATAHTPEEFVVLLRHVRDESGLTFWEIEERAAAHGIQLDPAAVVEALGGDELPEDALVAGLLLACGVTGRQLDRWMRVYEELSYMEPAEMVVPVRPGRRRLHVAGRRWKAKHLLIALVTAAVVVVAGVALTGMLGGPAMVTGAPSPAGSPSLGAASPSPSATPSPARSPARPSAPPVVTLTAGQGFDLDTGQTSGDGLDVVATEGGMRAGDNGKRLALMPAGTTPSKDTCDAIVPGQLDRALSGLSVGRFVCVKTDQGRWARLSITGTGAGLKFSYLLWS